MGSRGGRTKKRKNVHRNEKEIKKKKDILRGQNTIENEMMKLYERKKLRKSKNKNLDETQKIQKKKKK